MCPSPTEARDPYKDTWSEEAVELGREAGTVWYSVGSGRFGTQRFPLECTQSGRDFILLFTPQEGAGDLLTNGSQLSSSSQEMLENFLSMPGVPRQKYLKMA